MVVWVLHSTILRKLTMMMDDGGDNGGISNDSKKNKWP